MTGKRRFGLMSKAELQAEEDAQKRAKETRYDRSRLALVYTRQSTDGQLKKNKESALEQKEGLVKYAQAYPYEWDADKILLINENLFDKHGNRLEKPRAASGTKDSSLRAGLLESERLIKEDKVGIVFIESISRLFRDKEGINPPQFAKTCKEHHTVVVVYADDKEYDFNTERGDLKDFLEKCQYAAYEMEVLAKRLLKRKLNKAERGGFAGHSIACGFMLDEQRENYVSNPLWSPVVAQLTRRYRELDADLTALHNEIYGVAIFSELPEEIASRVGRIQLQRVGNGYTIASRSALRQLLINPANIGHKVYRERIVKENAHPAIVDREDFDFAVAHLARVDLDNNVIEREKRTARYTQGDSQKREGLLSGVRSTGKPVITSSQGSVYVFQHEGHGKTAYVAKDNHYGEKYSGSVAIDIVDAAVSQRLEDKLYDVLHHALESDSIIQTVMDSAVMSDKPEAQTWHKGIQAKMVATIQQEQTVAQGILNHMASLRNQVQMSLGKVDETIQDIERKITLQQKEYSIARDVMSDQDIKEHFASLARLRTRLADLQEKQEQSAKIESEISLVTTRLTRASEQWGTMTLDERRAFIRLVTTDIQLDVLSERIVKLTIVWSPVIADKAEYTLLIRDRASGADWTTEEDAIMREMYAQSERDSILLALPRRSWVAIKNRAVTLELHRSKVNELGEMRVPKNIALEDWLVMQAHGIEVTGSLTGLWYTGVIAGINDVYSSKLASVMGRPHAAHTKCSGCHVPPNAVI